MESFQLEEVVGESVPSEGNGFENSQYNGYQNSQCNNGFENSQCNGYENSQWAYPTPYVPESYPRLFPYNPPIFPTFPNPNGSLYDSLPLDGGNGYENLQWNYPTPYMPESYPRLFPYQFANSVTGVTTYETLPPDVNGYENSQWTYPMPCVPESYPQLFPYNSPVLPNFSNNMTIFPTLPTALSHEINDGSTLTVPPSKEKVPNLDEKTDPKSKNATVSDIVAKKVLVSPASLGTCEEKIRFRNRDYYGMPVNVNVSKCENNSDQSWSYNLTRKQTKSSKQRGSVKPVNHRNPFSTKFTVKNLKKILELQHKILTPVKDGDKIFAQVNGNSANELSENDKSTNQDCTNAYTHMRSNIINGSVVSTSDGGFISFKSPTNCSSKFTIEKQKMSLPHDVQRLHLRNRSYEFVSLEIGSFIVQSTQQTVSRNKLRFYFSQKQMVYDFEYSYQVDGLPVSVLLLVMVYVSLDSVVAASFRSREVEFILNKAPKIVSGFDRNKIPNSLKMRNFGQTTIDVTRGALNSVLVHKVTLPRAQGELIQKHLVQFNPTLNNTRI